MPFKVLFSLFAITASDYHRVTIISFLEHASLMKSENKHFYCYTLLKIKRRIKRNYTKEYLAIKEDF